MSRFPSRRINEINPNSPAEALAGLARDESWGVCWEVAQNANCPPEVLGACGREWFSLGDR